MAEYRELRGAQGLRLAADVSGPADGPPALLLHGFGRTRQSWDARPPSWARKDGARTPLMRAVMATAIGLPQPRTHMPTAAPRC